MRYTPRWFITLAACTVAMSAAAATTITELPTTAEEIVVDGVMDEPAWQDAVTISMDIETKPGENIPARVETTAYLIENGNSLFVAIDARDPDPSQIRAYLRDRDTIWNDDFAGISIDSYGDERRAFEFFANALGVQADATFDDVNRHEDFLWDAIWESAGKINDDGYIIEMEIPLSQLRFEKSSGKQTWGIDLLRYHPRDRTYRYSNNSQDRDINCYLCQFERIEGLENVEPSRDLEIVPTLTASQVDTTDQPGIEPLSSGDPDAEAGLTVRWGITPDMTANLAINPDFSQVEADAPQLDVNNQFALFFPEKRPFFLEGADYFNTPIDAVFTRTVADPSIGLKLTGKRDKNTIGVFAAQDEITNLIFPGSLSSSGTSLNQENTAFVGRYARSFGQSSSIGALLTTRSGDNYHNNVGGLDLRWKIGDNHNVRAQLLRSDTEYPDQTAIDFSQPLGSFDGDAGFFAYDFDSRNWFGRARYQRRSSGFRADAGFVPRVDIEQTVIGGGRIWHGDEDDWYSRIRLNGDWDIAYDEQGRVLEREVEGYFFVEGPLQSKIELGALTRDVLWNDQMFEEDKTSIFAELQPIGGLVLGLWTRWGTQVDFANTQLGDELRMQPSVNWNVSRHLLLRYDGSYVQLDTRAGEMIFDAKVHDVRLTWQFNLRSFIRLTAQVQDIKRNPAVYVDPVDAHSKNVGRQLLYSYKLNPQTVFFLGYSDALIDDDALTGLTTTDRTLFMKIGYAWTP